MKLNKSYEVFYIHEILINEEIFNSQHTLIDENLNIHSISMIKKNLVKIILLKIIELNILFKKGKNIRNFIFKESVISYCKDLLLKIHLYINYF